MMGLANWQKLDVFQCSFVNSAADTLEKLHLLLNLSSMTVSFGDDTINIAIPVLEDLKFRWKVLAYVFDAHTNLYHTAADLDIVSESSFQKIIQRFHTFRLRFPQ
jgi:hypothetical protein